MSRHRHVCACGARLYCRQEPDHCDLKHWDCPRCEDAALEAYMTRLESDLHRTFNEQETNREHQQRIS